MDREKQDCAAIILCGDFNGPPHEPFHALLRRLGYVSAHAQRHGREPQASLLPASQVLLAAWLGGSGRGHGHANTPAMRAAAARQPGSTQQVPTRCACSLPDRLAVQGTWPTGIQAPLMDVGDFECLDYVYVWTAPEYTSK
jgi:endonuclease/exonuclease/phosphatase family metal-dependent hydrolase